MRIGLTLLALIAPVVLPAACLMVDSDQIRASDLVVSDTAWSKVPGDTVLGFSPVPGLRRILREEALSRVASQHGLTLSSKGDLCVERPMRTLAKSDFEQAIQASLANSRNDRARYELVDFSRYAVPAGSLLLPLSALSEPPSNRPETPVLWRGYVTYGKGRRFGVWARVRIFVKRTQVVARGEIAVNQEITEADVELREVETFPFRSGPAPDLKSVIGKLTRRTLQAGDPVTLTLLAEPFAVRRGDSVVVEVQSGRAKLSVEGVAERGGRMGDLLPVRNPSSGKSFLAQIVGKGKAKVSTGVR